MSKSRLVDTQSGRRKHAMSVLLRAISWCGEPWIVHECFDGTPNFVASTPCVRAKCLSDQIGPAPSASGHRRKCSERSNDFRSASLSGHDRASLAVPLSARNGHFDQFDC